MLCSSWVHIEHRPVKQLRIAKPAPHLQDFGYVPRRLGCEYSCTLRHYVRGPQILQPWRPWRTFDATQPEARPKDGGVSRKGGRGRVARAAVSSRRQHHLLRDSTAPCTIFGVLPAFRAPPAHSACTWWRALPLRARPAEAKVNNTGAKTAGQSWTCAAIHAAEACNSPAATLAVASFFLSLVFPSPLTASAMLPFSGPLQEPLRTRSPEA